MSFDLIIDENEAKAHVHRFPLWPRKWDEFDRRDFDYSWVLEKLDADSQGNIPNESGIYTLLVQPGIANHIACSYLMYLGKSNSLRRRFGEYLNEAQRSSGRPLIHRFLNMYPDHSWFCYAIIPDHDLESYEDLLLEAYLPPKNKKFPARVRRIVEALRE